MGRISRFRENLMAGVMSVGVSFGRWNLCADDHWVRHRYRIRNWIWTPFYRYTPRAKGVRISMIGVPEGTTEFTRSGK